MNVRRSCALSVWSDSRHLLMGPVPRLCGVLAFVLSTLVLQASAATLERGMGAAPETHRQTSRRTVSLDGEPAILTRYERRDGRNAGLGGEHFSTVIAVNGKLKGFANISLDPVGRPLPSRERTEQLARLFLRELAPELLSSMQISSIAQHDEPMGIVRAGRKETVQLSGMKFKARNLVDGRWFWLVVGSDEKPILFERDLEWSFLLGRRKTEQWLYDPWLRKQAAGRG